MEDDKIFENDQWVLRNWGIEEKVDENHTPYYIEKGLIQNYPKEQFSHVLGKMWVVPRLWKEVFIKALDQFAVDTEDSLDGFIHWLDKQVAFEKEVRRLGKDIKERLGRSSGSYAEYLEVKKHILQENHEFYPLHTKVRGDDGGQS